MITSLRLSNFRAFESLVIEDLGRVNLFVGKNNSGKTSVLEAVALLATEGNPAVLFQIAENRGEVILPQTRDITRARWEYDISHLFRGHILGIGSSFEVEGLGTKHMKIQCRVIDVEDVERDLFGETPEIASPICLSLSTSTREVPSIIDLSSWGGVDRNIARRLTVRNGEERKPMCLVPTGGLDNWEMSLLWDEVALTSEETQVVEVLRIVEPALERIAFLSRERYRDRPFGGIIVKLEGMNNRLPLGSLGDGAKLLLGLSLAIIQSAEGCAMIDEIDTGIHYSVMPKMWEMVIQTAERLNVQVFATTHSQDCVEGFATLHREKPQLCKHVRVHRIDRDLEKAVTYSAPEIAIAEEHQIEVR